MAAGRHGSQSGLGGQSLKRRAAQVSKHRVGLRDLGSRVVEGLNVAAPSAEG
jgi:hypothetical protein